jgi:hypothetical protein
MKIKTGNEPVKKKKQQCITRPEVVVVNYIGSEPYLIFQSESSQLKSFQFRFFFFYVGKRD